MRIIKILILSIVLISFGLHFLAAQAAGETQDVARVDDVMKKRIVYNPAGRRDPFRDLLAGGEVKDKLLKGGISQMSIDDIVLIGIAKIKENYSAIINSPQGFPYTIREGNKFADGYVLSIDESKVTFRQTKERGVPLYKPRNVIKEINPEER